MSHLHDMRRRFCEVAARPVRHAANEHTFENIHWGLELVLKAYLHAHGWTDERCIAEIRHDIALALSACEREGLRGVNKSFRALVAALSPFSKRRRVARFVEAGADGFTSEQAIAAAESICGAVSQALGRTPEGDSLPLRPSL